MNNKEAFRVPEDPVQLLRARIENQKAVVEQARAELDSAADKDKKELWGNRLKQREEALKQAERELEEALLKSQKAA